MLITDKLGRYAVKDSTLGIRLSYTAEGTTYTLGNKHIYTSRWGVPERRLSEKDQRFPSTPFAVEGEFLCSHLPSKSSPNTNGETAFVSHAALLRVVWEKEIDLRHFPYQILLFWVGDIA